MKNVRDNCPVPLEQQPNYEYINLKNKLIFKWTTTPVEEYSRTVVKIVLTIFFCISIITCVSSNSSETNHMCISYLNLKHILIFTSIICNLVFSRIYLGWVYIYNRLTKATISYEESGWYDGQVWVKNPEALIKDKLLAEYTIHPIIKRVKITLISLCSLLFISICFI